jgi:hypothetical protein
MEPALVGGIGLNKPNPVAPSSIETIMGNVESWFSRKIQIPQGYHVLTKTWKDYRLPLYCRKCPTLGIAEYTWHESRFPAGG